MEDINQLYREITKRAKANGVVDQEGWDGIVDEVIEQYRTTEGEIDMLDMALAVQPNSRLSCQLTCSEELDGIKVSLAPE